MGDFPEVNALAAFPTGSGVGTALLAEAEKQTIRSGVGVIGLAVEPTNINAVRLYLRLGYVEWPKSTVVDTWNEVDETGNLLSTHHDECIYMTKPLNP